MKERSYQFRQRLSAVHSPGRRDYDKTCPAGYVEVDGGWCIEIPCGADEVVLNAARDLEDYFFTSMGVSLRLVTERENAGYAKKIVYSLNPALKAHSYRFAVSENSVALCGVDSRMAAQAGYFLEDLMNLEEGPFLQKQDIVRTSLFNPRMVHSGYGLDMFPAEHMRVIAHAGISALLVFVTGVNRTPRGYKDFNDLCLRAAKFGLDVYVYSYLADKMHPADEGAYAFYEDLYGKLFDCCPYFKGIVFVGESCEFPSRDGHSMGVRRLDNRDENGNPLREQTKPYPGWWPCYDYKDLMEMIGGILRARKPDIDIVFWSYNWNSAPADKRKALIDTLPRYITVQATFEMGDTVVRDGVETRPADYTIYTPGPGYYFRTEAEFAAENGLRLYAMTNAGGLTWDVGVIPYVPAPYQWIKRFEAMRRACETYGLSGTMDAHHYGFFPSFISDLAKWACYAPYADLEETLRRLAARDFSQETADGVCEAYRYLSEGTRHHISTVADQYGPCRVGPSYPFILFDHQNEDIPVAPGASRHTFPVYGNPWGRPVLGDEKKQKTFDYETGSLRKAEAFYDMGCAILKGAIDKIPDRKKDNANRILALCLFYRNTLRTTVGLREFYKRKFVLKDTHGAARNALIDRMLEICRREEKNAAETIPLVESDSRLGYEPSMEYMTDRAHIEWKLGLIRDLIARELPSYYE